MKISSFEEGMNAYNDRDYKTAFNIFQVLAEGNNADALNLLGKLYEDGVGVGYDFEKALWHYRKAADQQHVGAQLNLGWLYYDQEERHNPESLHWFRKAADQGNPTAQWQIGLIYQDGDLVDLDVDCACEWYVKSAKQERDSFALEDLVELCFGDNDSEDDDKRSFNCFKEIAMSEFNCGRVMNVMAWAYQNGRGVSSDPEKALALYKEVANSSSDESSNSKWQIGVLYAIGIGVKRDGKIAEKWMVDSAKSDIRNTYKLANVYSEGYIIGNRPEKAVALYNKVIKSNHTWLHEEANNKLGIYYYKVKRDFDKAFHYFNESSKGSSSSQYYLGHLHEYGQGVLMNYKAAVEWYEQAAEGGHSEAQYSLGYMYAHGDGVEQDDDLAIKWYAKSAIKGNLEAKNNLHAVCYYDKVKDEGRFYNFNSYAQRIEYTHNEIEKISIRDFQEDNDCSVVAIAIACGVNYTKVHQMFADVGRSHRGPAGTHSIIEILTRLEQTNLEIFSQERLKNMKTKIGRGLTSNNIVEALPKGRFIIETKGHVAALVDGEIKDWTIKRRFRVTGIIKIPDKREDKSLSDEQINILNYYNGGQMLLHIFNGDNRLPAAFEWFRTAADSGHIKAQTQLAKMYDQGIGVKKDSYKAARWYTSAAQCGDPEAQYEIAKKYEFGDGVGKDFAVSRRWLFTMADNLKKTLGSDWNQMFTEPDF